MEIDIFHLPSSLFQRFNVSLTEKGRFCATT